jgi:hypothetical protein
LLAPLGLPSYDIGFTNRDGVPLRECDIDQSATNRAGDTMSKGSNQT